MDVNRNCLATLQRTTAVSSPPSPQLRLLSSVSMSSVVIQALINLPLFPYLIIPHWIYTAWGQRNVLRRLPPHLSAAATVLVVHAGGTIAAFLLGESPGWFNSDAKVLAGLLVWLVAVYTPAVDLLLRRWQSRAALRAWSCAVKIRIVMGYQSMAIRVHADSVFAPLFIGAVAFVGGALASLLVSRLQGGIDKHADTFMHRTDGSLRWAVLVSALVYALCSSDGARHFIGSDAIVPLMCMHALFDYVVHHHLVVAENKEKRD